MFVFDGWRERERTVRSRERDEKDGVGWDGLGWLGSILGSGLC